MIKDYIHQQFDPSPLVEKVIQEWYRVHLPQFYDIDTSRERMSPALSRTRTYHLRKPVIDRALIVKTESTQDILECRDTPLYEKFPVLRDYINWIGDTYFGGWAVMGRVFITRMEPDSDIGRHIDEGKYFESLHRHHIVLRSKSALFCWDNDERIVMSTGQLWRVNNSIPHWVENGDSPRTHIIFDARGVNDAD